MKLILNLFLLTTIGCADFMFKYKRHLASVDEIDQVESQSVMSNLNNSGREDEDLVTALKPNQETNDELIDQRPQSTSFYNEEKKSNSDGSLWNASGQRSFLFSRNTLREIGDMVIVKMDKRLIEDLNKDINRITTKHHEKKKKTEEIKLRQLASSLQSGPIPASVVQTAETPLSPTLAKQVNPNLSAIQKAIQDLSEKKEVIKNYFEDADISTRVVRKTGANVYQVEGSKLFFIEDKKYKLLFSGLVKGDDIKHDDSISTKEVMDSNVSFGK